MSGFDGTSVRIAVVMFVISFDGWAPPGYMWAFALSAYGETMINGVDWRVALIDKLAALQQADGSWSGEKRWMEANPILVTSYAVQALEAAREDLKARPAK